MLRGEGGLLAPAQTLEDNQAGPAGSTTLAKWAFPNMLGNRRVVTLDQIFGSGAIRAGEGSIGTPQKGALHGRANMESQEHSAKLREKENDHRSLIAFRLNSALLGLGGDDIEAETGTWAMSHSPAHGTRDVPLIRTRDEETELRRAWGDIKTEDEKGKGKSGAKKGKGKNDKGKIVFPTSTGKAQKGTGRAPI